MGNWKREQIPDHKFDYIDIEDFKSKKLWDHFCYIFVYIFTLKSILVYMADMVIIVVTLISFSLLERILNNSDTNLEDCQNAGLPVAFCGTQTTGLSKQLPTAARLGIMFGSIIFSFVLLFWEWRKAIRIIKSRDISYALTSTIAYRYYAIQSYPHYCFFTKIENSRKMIDILAFYVFFTFKNWKKLLLAEFPRQLIYGFLLIDTYNALRDSSTITPGSTAANVTVYRDFFGTLDAFYSTANRRELQIAYSLMAFTVLVWIASFTALVVAFLIYIPLLCEIRGNLKEYCCHKIDKRISEILKKKSKKRMEEARKAELRELEQSNRMRRANGNGSVFSSETGTRTKPTLPSITDDDINAPHPIYWQRPYEPSETESDHSTMRSDRPLMHGYFVPPVYQIAQYPRVVHANYPLSEAASVNDHETMFTRRQ